MHEAPGASDLAVPENWGRPQWTLFIAMAAGSVVAVLIGAVVAFAGGEYGLRTGAIIVSFGLTLAVTVPMFWPSNPRRAPEAGRIVSGQEWEQGVAFPYTRLSSIASYLGALMFALTSLGLFLFPAAIGGADPTLAGKLTLIRLAGGAGLVFFGACAIVTAGRLWARSAVVLSETAVALVRGGDITSARWDAVTSVGLLQYSSNPFVALQVEDWGLSVTGRARKFERWLSRLAPADVMVPVRGQTVDPRLLAHAIGYYWEHTDKRGELGADAGLERIRNSSFGPSA